jgi:methyl-accepting chemotaxis protein
VLSVASAVEEMSSTIREISTAVNDSSKVAQRAVSVTQDASAVIKKLHVNSEQIDQVIRTITTIAGQTNILALNATIEAARAGEAGKGFAVVANAVKELARETATATKDISARLEQIRGQAMEAVSSIEEINHILLEVERSSKTIAVAVEEQSSATNEISRNMSEATVGVNQVVEIVLGVAAAAGDNSSKLAQARESAENMGSLAKRLGTIIRG